MREERARPDSFRRDHNPLARSVLNSLADSLNFCFRFPGPVTQTQELPDFASFVAIFLGFGGPIFRLSEWMLSVSYGFLN